MAQRFFLVNAQIDAARTDPHPLAAPLRCSACRCVHQAVALAPGERARCVRCGTTMARGTRFGLDTTLACAITGALLIVPATMQPFITVSKLANERIGVLFTGVGTLWQDGMRLLSIWVMACGGIVPFVLLSVLIAIVLPLRFGWRERPLRGLCVAARAIEHWSMPEVHVLAVLVALVKLNTLVAVHIGPGFWCYAALSFMTLLAWRSFDLENLESAPAPRAVTP